MVDAGRQQTRLSATGPARSLLIALVLAVLSNATQARDRAGVFDYWVLALTWAPEYCKSNLTDPQCAEPHNFIVHGLWPQREKGYPDYCDADAPRVPDELESRMLHTIPSRDAIQHQWRKHGSCSGLSVTDYFYDVELAAGKIAIPLDYETLSEPTRTNTSAIESAFMALNPRLSQDGIAVQCRGHYLKEVRICLDRKFQPRACGTDVVDKCKKSGITIRPPRQH